MPQNFSQYFRTLQILFFALLIGQIAVLTIVYFVLERQRMEDPMVDLAVKLLPVLLFAQIGLAFFLNRKKLETARSQTTLQEKLAAYRTASILKWAPIEAGSLISIVLFFAWGNVAFLYFAGAMIILFATQFPSRQKLINELDLSAGEQMILDDPNAVVAETRYRNA